MRNSAIRSSPWQTRTPPSVAAASFADAGRLRIVRDPLRVALFVLTLITISRIHQHYAILQKVRPALLLVVASIGYAYLNPRYLTDTNVLRLWPMRLVAILGVLACASAPFGLSLGGSAAFILDSYAKTLAYAFLLAVSVRHVRDLFTFVWAYVVSCGILAYFSLFVFGISKASNSYVTRLNNLYMYDSNDLGVVMMVGLPLTLLLFAVERGTKRMFLLLVLIAIAATMARSGSRGGFIGFVAVLAAGLVLVSGVSASKRLLVAATVSIALVVGAPPGYWEQMRTILNPKEDYNYTDVDGRKAVMQRGIGYMMQYPLFGVGVNNFSRAECTISPKLASLRTNGPLKCSAPHNSHLEAASELGIPGFFVWASLIIAGIIAPLRLRRRLPLAWRRGTPSERFLYAATGFFSVSMIGFATTAFFVSFAWMDPVYVLAALLTGLYISCRVQIEQSTLVWNDTPSQMSTMPVGPGWRVRRSAWRAALRAQSQTAAGC